ncbi:hypothetical protein [Brevibacterium samyangense]
MTPAYACTAGDAVRGVTRRCHDSVVSIFTGALGIIIAVFGGFCGLVLVVLGIVLWAVGAKRTKR